ncbi:MAG: hypothetical protein V2A69_14985, partial [Pseudomonadota bacterium]
MEQEESSPAFAYLFIPSLPSHLSHMLVASFETTAFAVAGITFWFFRIMIAIGFLYFLVMMWAGLLWRKKQLYHSRPFLLTLVVLQPL